MAPGGRYPHQQGSECARKRDLDHRKECDVGPNITPARAPVRPLRIPALEPDDHQRDERDRQMKRDQKVSSAGKHVGEQRDGGAEQQRVPEIGKDACHGLICL